MFNIAYDDVTTDEAISLIMQLEQGSHYKASLSKQLAWTKDQELLAFIVDSIERLIMLKATGSTKDAFRIPRPWDKEEKKPKKKINVEKLINETTWEEA